MPSARTPSTSSTIPVLPDGWLRPSKLPEPRQGEAVHPLLPPDAVATHKNDISDLLWLRCASTNFFHFFGTLAAEDLRWLPAATLLLSYDSPLFRDILAIMGTFYMSQLCMLSHKPKKDIRWCHVLADVYSTLDTEKCGVPKTFTGGSVFAFALICNQQVGYPCNYVSEWREIINECYTLLQDKAKTAKIAAKSNEMKVLAAYRLFLFTYEWVQTVELSSMLSSDVRSGFPPEAPMFTDLPEEIRLPFLHSGYNPVRGYDSNLGPCVNALYGFLLDTNKGGAAHSLSGINILRLRLGNCSQEFQAKASDFATKQLEFLKKVSDSPWTFEGIHNPVTAQSYGIIAHLFKQGLLFYFRFFFLCQDQSWEKYALDAVILLNDNPCPHKFTPTSLWVIYQYFLASLWQGNLDLCLIFVDVVKRVARIPGQGLAQRFAKRLDFLLANVVKEAKDVESLPEGFAAPIL